MNETNEILECVDKVIIKQSRDITRGDVFLERMAENINALAKLVEVRAFLYPTVTGIQLNDINQNTNPSIALCSKIERKYRNVEVGIHGELEYVPLLESEELLKMNAKYIETDNFSGYDIYEDDKGKHYAEEG